MIFYHRAITFIGCCLLGMSSCALLHPITLNNYHLSEPPNGVAFADNLYCDKTETDNLSWTEYMYWTARVFGYTSDEYAAAIPDTTVWTTMGLCWDNFMRGLDETYLRHPYFDEFPVVGISQEQAKAYSQWRSDRVFEGILIRLKQIQPHSDQNADNHFTIERYFRGELSYVLPGKGKKPMYYPEFRLPTLPERQQMLEYADATDKAFFDKRRSKKWRPCTDNFPFIHSDIPFCRERGMPPTTAISQGCAAIFQHLQGNVNEWLAEPNLAAGGSWQDQREVILRQDTFTIAAPNMGTGFRNVCRWIRWEG
jgi:hypothetical protein